MKKEDVLLRLIAISGELPAGLVGEIVESESYAAALITRLKKENYISVRNAGGYKGYVLRGKGSDGASINFLETGEDKKSVSNISKVSKA